MDDDASESLQNEPFVVEYHNEEEDALSTITAKNG